MIIKSKDEEMGDVIDSGGGLPPTRHQKRVIDPLLNSRSLKEGDYWRIIPFKWLEVSIARTHHYIPHYKQLLI